MSPELRKFFFENMRDPLLQNRDYAVFRWCGDGEPIILYQAMEDLRREFQEKRPGCQLFVRGHLCRIFSILSDTRFYEARCVNLGADEGYSLALSAKQVLDKCDHRISKQQLAKRLSYSAEHINQVFLHHYGCTIPEYNRRACLRQAAMLLRETSLHVHEIVRRIGFSNRTNFYKLFEKEYGCTPAEYRRNN